MIKFCLPQPHSSVKTNCQKLKSNFITDHVPYRVLMTSIDCMKISAMMETPMKLQSRPSKYTTDLASTDQVYSLTKGISSPTSEHV